MLMPPRTNSADRFMVIDIAEHGANEQARLYERRMDFNGGATVPIGWKCSGCGNTDECSRIQQSDALVCPCGAVVRAGGAQIATHRERLGATEDDDKTQHADRVVAQRQDRFDHAPPSKEERKAQHRRECCVSSVPMGKRVLSGQRRLYTAHTQVVKAAVREERSRASLTPRDELKFYKILYAIEDLFRAFAPIHHSIKRAVRIATDVVWKRAAEHGTVCSGARCDISLKERTPYIIAQSMFEHTIESIVDGHARVDGVDRAHVLELQNRMHRNAQFNNVCARTQATSTKAQIHLIYSDAFNPKVACLATPHQLGGSSSSLDSLDNCNARNNYYYGTNTRPSRVRDERHNPLLQRVDSSASSFNDALGSSRTVEMRDSITKVFAALNMHLKTDVKRGALQCIQTPGVMATLHAMQTSTTGSVHKLTYCLLYAIAYELDEASSQLQHVDCSMHCISLNAQLAHKLKLSLTRAKEIIAALRTSIPIRTIITATLSECQ
tara:strand:- start:1818 stop:3305 length:1488 start_codon:yes stop_codon:yes gene_type:complete